MAGKSTLAWTDTLILAPLAPSPSPSSSPHAHPHPHSHQSPSPKLAPNPKSARCARGTGRCRYIQVVHGVPGQHGRRAYRADQFVAANPTMHAEYHHVWAKCAAALKQVRSDFPIRAMCLCTALRFSSRCVVSRSFAVVDVDIVLTMKGTLRDARRAASGPGHRGPLARVGGTWGHVRTRAWKTAPFAYFSFSERRGTMYCHV